MKFYLNKILWIWIVYIYEMRRIILKSWFKIFSYFLIKGRYLHITKTWTILLEIILIDNCFNILHIYSHSASVYISQSIMRKVMFLTHAHVRDKGIMQTHIFRSRCYAFIYSNTDASFKHRRIRVSITKTVGHMSQQNTRMYLQRRITRYRRSHVWSAARVQRRIRR